MRTKYFKWVPISKTHYKTKVKSKRLENSTLGEIETSGYLKLCVCVYNFFFFLCTIFLSYICYMEKMMAHSSEKREINVTSYSTVRSSVFRIVAVPHLKLTFAESSAQAFPGGNLLSYICVGQATWVVEWPICSHWQSPREAGMATAKLNVLHSVHDHWEGKHQMAHPCCGPSMWKHWCHGEVQTWQMSSTGKNKQHIRKLCFWSYLPCEGLG